MVRVRLYFKSHEVKQFITFSIAEAESLVDEYDIKNLISIHFYPNYKE